MINSHLLLVYLFFQAKNLIYNDVFVVYLIQQQFLPNLRKHNIKYLVYYYQQTKIQFLLVVSIN